MSRVIVTNNVTLDGVMQAPARPDEDRRGGFEHGGWALPFNDAVMNDYMAQRISNDGAMLFGRRTYEDFASVWPGRTDNPFSEILDKRRKYVASRTLQEPLEWVNSTLLEGDAADAVATLKQQTDQDLAVLGSGELIRSLNAAQPQRRILAADPPARAWLRSPSPRRGSPRQSAARRFAEHEHRCGDRDLPSDVRGAGMRPAPICRWSQERAHRSRSAPCYAAPGAPPQAR